MEVAGSWAEAHGYGALQVCGHQRSVQVPVVSLTPLLMGEKRWREDQDRLSHGRSVSSFVGPCREPGLSPPPHIQAGSRARELSGLSYFL